VDPRIILIGTDKDQDETFNLRLAIMNNNIDSFLLFWNNFGYIYDGSHLLVVARFLIHTHKLEILEQFLQSQTTRSLFINCDKQMRTEFMGMLKKAQLPAAARLALSKEPYVNSEFLDIDEHTLH
jgi:hypothetical protein